MATFALIHGAADVGWYWHRVVEELRSWGHRAVAPDLPCEDDSAGLNEFTRTVVEAVEALGAREQDEDLVVVGHSYGAFTAPLVASQLPVATIVLVAGMIPKPGEAPKDWWANTGYGQAAREQAQRDGGLTGNEDPIIGFYHDVPRPLAEEALRRGRGQSEASGEAPWPLAAWPNVTTKFVLCQDDRLFPADFFRRLVPERLGITPDEIPGSHCVALSRPKELASILIGYT